MVHSGILFGWPCHANYLGPLYGFRHGKPGGGRDGGIDIGIGDKE